MPDKTAKLVLTSPDADVWIGAVVDGNTTFQACWLPVKHKKLNWQKVSKMFNWMLVTLHAWIEACWQESFALPESTVTNQPRTISFNFAGATTEDDQNTEGN